MLKRYENVVYRLIPRGILFPAPVKNNTEQIFITCRELNDVKKALLGRTDLKKINNWEEIRGHSLWINTTLGKQREINNSRHRTLNDLLNFSINLVDDNNK